MITYFLSIINLLAYPELTYYWDHVDYVVESANRLGMYVGLLPTWGRYWHDNLKENGGKPLFNEWNAKEYGRFLGKRYGEKRVIWILGGDRKVESEEQRRIIEAMAHGIKEGGGRKQLITFHPSGRQGSSQWFHEADWLDFNMRQNGHVEDYSAYVKTLDDYRLSPFKPVIDGEPIYEDHPVAFRPERYGHSVAADVRRAFYWDVFNGAFGHTYGHHSVWQMYDSTKHYRPVNYPLMSWREALDQPGARQMGYGRRLMESRPFFSRIPDSSVIKADKVATAIPGAGRYRFVATRDKEGTYLMVYVPVGRPFTVRTDVIEGTRLKAWWYNPRDGEASLIGVFANEGERRFTPPALGEVLDWVLVIDDASCRYPAPGKRR